MPLLHVPLLVCFDGTVPRGVRVTEPVSLRDLPATVLDLAGIREHPLPGRSLRARWEEAAAERRSDTVADDPGGALHLEPGEDAPLAELETGPRFSIVHGRWHDVVQPSTSHEEFYDLAVDPDEVNDLSDSPRYREEISAARREAIRLLEDDL